MKLTIIIGTTTFTATLNNNPTVTSFKARLPMTISMSDLNANEKYFDLPANLPANASNPGTIQIGDLMRFMAAALCSTFQDVKIPFTAKFPLFTSSQNFAFSH